MTYEDGVLYDGVCEKEEKYKMVLGVPDCMKDGLCEYQKSIHLEFEGEPHELRVCGLVLGEKDISKLPIIRTVARALEERVEPIEDHEGNHT